jgi:hypothetical protein
MKKISLILLFLLLCPVTLHSQVTLSARFVKVIRDQNAIPLTGLDVKLNYWNSSSVAYTLDESTISPGTYYKDSVEYGLYDIYVNGQMRESSIFHGANKMNYIADKFTNDLIQLITEGIKDSAVVWDKLSEAVKDSIRKRKLGDNVWDLIMWADLSEAVKDSIRKRITQTLPEGFLHDLIGAKHGIKISKGVSDPTIVKIGFDSLQAEKDTIYVRMHPDSMQYIATRGNFIFRDSGCIRIWAKIGIDTIMQDTIVVNDTISTIPLVILSDTLIGNRYVDVADTVYFDMSRCYDDIKTNICLDTLTVPIYLRRTVTAYFVPSDSTMVCDSVCTRWNVSMKDTSFVILDNNEMATVMQLQRMTYGFPCDSSRIQPSHDPTLCVRKYAPDKWLVNLLEGDPNYPFRACPTLTKCDTTSICCIRKSIIYMYLRLANKQPVNSLWIDSTLEVVDCNLYKNDPNVFIDTVNCRWVYGNVTLYVDTSYSYIKDTVIVYDKCLYPCPKAHILQGLYTVYDTTYSYIPIVDAVHIGYDTISVDPNLRQTWYVLIDSVTTKFPPGSQNPTNPPYGNSGLCKSEIDYYRSIWPSYVDTLHHFAVGWGIPPPYRPGFMPFTYGMATVISNQVTGIAYQCISLNCHLLHMMNKDLYEMLYLNHPPFYPNSRLIVWFPVDSLLLWGCPPISCEIDRIWTRGVLGTECHVDTFKTVICFNPFTGQPIAIDTFWYQIPYNHLGLTCDQIIVDKYRFDTLRIDTLRYISQGITGWQNQLFISDTCACSDARIFVPSGQSIKLCGDIYIRNDCINGSDPYIDGNTIVFNYSCGQGIGTNLVDRTELLIRIVDVIQRMDSLFSIVENEILRLESKIDSCCALSGGGTSPIVTTMAMTYYNGDSDSTSINLPSDETYTAIESANFSNMISSDFSYDKGHYTITSSDTGYYKLDISIVYSTDENTSISFVFGNDGGETKDHTKYTDSKYLGKLDRNISFSTIVNLSSAGKYGLYAMPNISAKDINIHNYNLVITKIYR